MSKTVDLVTAIHKDLNPPRQLAPESSTVYLIGNNGVRQIE